MDVQWYPGHMTKARREIEENLKRVDLILEMTDARIPFSGRNPDIQEMASGKARLLVLNKTDLADPEATGAWSTYYVQQGIPTIALNAQKGNERKKLLQQIRNASHHKIERDRKRGILSSTIRILVVGIPNVGKSTLINLLAGKASAKTGDRPGVTRGQQWIHVGQGIDLLDTPGLLWPKFEDPAVGMRLAWIGSIREELLQSEEPAWALIAYLRQTYPGMLAESYQILEDGSPQEILEKIALARGCLKQGGTADTQKASRLLLDAFRHARLGRVTLEMPEE